MEMRPCLVQGSDGVVCGRPAREVQLPRKECGKEPAPALVVQTAPRKLVVAVLVQLRQRLRPIVKVDDKGQKVPHPDPIGPERTLRGLQPCVNAVANLSLRDLRKLSKPLPKPAPLMTGHGAQSEERAELLRVEPSKDVATCARPTRQEPLEQVCKKAFRVEPRTGPSWASFQSVLDVP